ncbi:MATE family efflux transporter [Natrialba asiatica]|uniref:MATE efflux family protein n=1 Tax=Natrialba asiatica (strain ATCC 700177 / DSM 12278 / JCM 9576 / FERM P-10747 / NBRC 102637 / 172P1) TaxID=29540 RepID=M0B725_NATA1|nr:MATE family efflux transporter [Natrialba asiatica]ELZ05444.1 MATE efflux family protein [Natrialba asiatica DSM 12278]
MGIRQFVSKFFKGPDEFNLTEGGIGKPLFYLSLPIVLQNLFQVTYNLADTFWLGRHSTASLSAITFAFPMVFLMISLALGLSVAGSVLVAQHIGAGNDRKAEYAASQTMAYAAVASIVLGAIGFVFVDDFLVILGTGPEISSLVADYMRVYSVGLVGVFGFAVFMALMRGYGDTITPMYVMGGSVFLNVVLDPVMIFGFQNNPLFGYLGATGLEASLLELTGYTGSGVAGAAIATVFSRALAFVVGLAIMFRGNRGVRIRLGQMVPDLSFGRKVVDIGLPASIEGTARSLSITLLLFVLAMFPEEISAAYGIGTRIFSVIFLPALAVSQGIETITGQNIGAEKPDRAAKTNHFGARAMLAVLTGLGIITILAARPISSIFTDNPTVAAESASFLRYTALTFGFIGVMRAYTGGFRGAGKTLFAAVISVVTLGLIRLPVAWLGAEAIGATGLWIAFPISNVIGGVIAYLWFKRGTWREASLTESDIGADVPGSETPSDD